MQLREAILVRIRIGEAVEELSWEEWESRVRAGRITAATMVQFEPVTGEAFQAAGTLEMYRSMRSEERLDWQRFTVSDPPIVTALLVGLQIRVFWLTQVDRWRIWFLETWTRENSAIFEDGEGWRWLASGFLHVDLLHIASNTVFLAFASYNLERTLGRFNLVVLFVASVVGGGLLSSVLGPETSSLGSSGGVYGLIAAMVTFGFVRPELLTPQRRLFFLLTSLPYMIVMFLTGLQAERVDNAAHFGGLVTGLVLGGLLVPDAVERRPGSNLRTQIAVLGAVGLAMIVPRFVGPRLTPLQDAVDRKNNRAYVWSLLSRWGVLEASERPPRSLDWMVPANWTSSFDATRDMAFTSPSGLGQLRTWRVTEREQDALVDLHALASAWADEVREDFPNAVVGELEPALLAGRQGLQMAATIGAGGQGSVRRRLEWRGAAQGVWSLQAVWQVEVEAADWLAPLHRRLLGRVAWAQPIELQRAEAEHVAFPSLGRATEELARQEIRSGRWEDGVERLWAHVQAKPESPKRWQTALQALRPAVGRLADPDRWFTGALTHAPVSKTVEEIVAALQRLDRRTEAIGLLELAWAQNPGDRRLRRVRRQLGLSTELDPTTGRPWNEVYDALTGARAATEHSRLAPVNLVGAAAAGARYDAQRSAVASQTAIWVANGDARAVSPLLWLRFGSVDHGDSDALKTLFQELEGVPRGRTLSWLPESVAAAIVRNPDRLDVLRSSALPG